MQTFLPYADFDASAQVLDQKRLGKQRVETLQVMQALCQIRLLNTVEIVGKKRIDLPQSEWIVAHEPVGWDTHVVSRMWRGYDYQLMMYQRATCREWTSRGYRDTCLNKTLMVFEAAGERGSVDETPPWLGDERLHSAHRARLLEKAPEHYSQFGWLEAPSETYAYWPDV